MFHNLNCYVSLLFCWHFLTSVCTWRLSFPEHDFFYLGSCDLFRMYIILKLSFCLLRIRDLNMLLKATCSVKNIEELPFSLTKSLLSKLIMLKDFSHLNVKGDSFLSGFHIPCANVGLNIIQQIFGPILVPAVVLGLWLQRWGMFSSRRRHEQVSATAEVYSEYREGKRKGKTGTISGK